MFGWAERRWIEYVFAHFIDSVSGLVLWCGTLRQLRRASSSHVVRHGSGLARVRAQLSAGHCHAALAVGGLAMGLIATWQLHDPWVAIGAILLGASVPFTLIVLIPTNKQLIDPTLDPQSPRATSLLRRWNRLHAVRSFLRATAFGVLLCRAAMR